MAARFVSFADVEYRQDELRREFAESRDGRSRRAARRSARRAARLHRTAATATARTSTTTAPSAPRAAVPQQHRAHARTEPAGTVPGTTLPGVPTQNTTVVVDDRLPVG